MWANDSFELLPGAAEDEEGEGGEGGEEGEGEKQDNQTVKKLFFYEQRRREPRSSPLSPALSPGSHRRARR